MNRCAQLSDTELVSRILKGDEDAFIALYERYSAHLYQYAFKKLQDKQGAEDIVHDVFTSFWQRKDSLSLNSELSSYLFASVRNRAFDVFAHRQVQSRHLQSLQEFLTISSTSPADYRVRTQQLDEMIQKEIEALPERMREIFILSRRAHLSHGEIAERLDISKHTVDTQIKRALRILRHKLGPVASVYLIYFSDFWF